MVRGKRADETVEKRQGTLVDVPKSEAAREADRYAEIQVDIESKKEMLIAQAEKVVQAMKKTSQRVLSYTDDYGFKHTFTVIASAEKLRHTKRQED